MRTPLWLAMRTNDTYTYSMMHPRSERERCMREAPMDLCSVYKVRTRLAGGERQKETNKMKTAVGARKVSVRAGFLTLTLSSYLLPQRTSDVKIISAPDRKKSDNPYFVHSICQVAERAISIRSLMGMGKKTTHHSNYE